MFHKNDHTPFFGKGFASKLVGAGKGLARFVDNPVVQAGITALAPEVGAGLVAAKKYGLLEKLKN